MAENILEDLQKEFLNYSPGFYINRLVWLPGGFDSSESRDVVDEMCSLHTKKEDRVYGLPEGVELSDEYCKHSDDAMSFICDYALWGFVAEINIPDKYDFKFDDDGNFVSCAGGNGVSYIKYVYGETFEELLQVAVKVTEEVRQWMIKKDKEKKSKAKNVAKKRKE